MNRAPATGVPLLPFLDQVVHLRGNACRQHWQSTGYIIRRSPIRMFARKRDPSQFRSTLSKKGVERSKVEVPVIAASPIHRNAMAHPSA